VTSAIRVLVVDDSAFMRKVLANMLGSDPRIHVVGLARNGDEALVRVKDLQPDVMTLDIEMPGMNGLEVLRQVMDERPLPVIMVSSLTEEGAQATMLALDLGAVDFIPKQLNGSSVNIVGIQQELVDKVISAHKAKEKLRRLFGKVRGSARPADEGVRICAASAAEGPIARPTTSALSARGTKVVAIGCSTGGPKALQEIFPLFPKDFPAPILVVQHMPKFFTGPFAKRLNELSQIEVREARDGDVPEPGLALVAPGGLHMRATKRSFLEVGISLSAEPPMLHVPSVDVMLESVAQTFSGRAVGVILTGMGHDGQQGMKAIKAVNGRTIAQDEATCVVYGMPKAVVDNGLADKIVPLENIAGEIANMV
jgi:two-component system chemotaxis response regulator CheB